MECRAMHVMMGRRVNVDGDFESGHNAEIRWRNNLGQVFVVVEGVDCA